MRDEAMLLNYSCNMPRHVHLNCESFTLDSDCEQVLTSEL